MKTLIQYLETLKIQNIGILVTTRLLYSLTFYTTIFTLFLLKRGLDYWEIFFLESILSAAIFLFEIPSGMMADKFGRKKLIILSVTLFAFSAYITALSHSFFWFLVESFLYGVGVAAMSGTDSAMIYESLQQKEKTKLAPYAFSLTNLTESLAMVICLPIGGILAGYSLELPVYITCIPLTLAVVLTFFLKEISVNTDKPATAKGLAIKSLKAVWLHHPYLVLLEIAFSLVFGAVFSLNYLNQPLFISYHIPVEYFGFIMLVINLLMTLVVMLTPILKVRWGEAPLFFITIFLPGVLFILLSLESSLLWGILTFGLIIIINSLRSPVYQTLVNHQIHESERATILSMISFIGSLVGMGFKPLIGLMVDINLHMTFMVFGLLLVSLSVVVMAISRKLTYC